ncbi:MAG: hypothetical protein ACI8XO_000274 [Verrucomicrobiales bacterium]|jgi:hypothetical protein
MTHRIKRNTIKTRAGSLAVFGFLICLTVGWVVAGQLIGLRKSSDGTNVTVEFQSIPESLVEVWMSDSLDEWRLVGIVLGTGESVNWIDPEASEVDERYYRVVQKPYTEPGVTDADTDGDGFTDIYELTHLNSGLDPLTTNQVSSISAASIAIAAGGFETAPHQTEVTIQVSPPGAYPIAVWLEGGDGYGSGVSTHFVGGSHPQTGPAKITSGDGQTFLAAAPHPSAAAIIVTPDALGKAVLVLTSSNEIGEHCTVHARAGPSSAIEGSQAQSPAIAFEKGRLDVAFPRNLVRGRYATAVLTRSYNGQPLTDHQVVFFVQRVRVNGEYIEVDPDNPRALDPYASVVPSQALQSTNPSGVALAEVFVENVVGLESVEVKAQDLEVFGE